MLDLPLEVLAQWVPLGQARLRGQEEPGAGAGGVNSKPGLWTKLQT